MFQPVINQDAFISVDSNIRRGSQAGTILSKNLNEIDRSNFYNELLTSSYKELIDESRRQREDNTNLIVFNGESLPQPSYVILSDAVEVDFYSDRPECLVQQAAILAAEKIILNSKVSDRFVILHGMAPGMSTDSFAESKSSDSFFYLVDKEALEAAKPACLLQFCVDRSSEQFRVISFNYPQNLGVLIKDELFKNNS